MTPNKILIVEDNLTFRETIKFALDDKHYSFVEAGTIKEALVSQKKNAGVEVILLDLSLPDGNGGEFLERIKEHLSKYRVIILSEHEEKLAAEQAAKYGVFNYLPKAAESFTESLRFSVAQAFKDIERNHLKEKSDILEEKNNTLIRIQRKINSDIQENSDLKKAMAALEDVLDLICRSVRELVGAYTCHVRLYNLKRGDFDLTGFAGPSEEVKKIFKGPRRKGQFFSGRVAETGIAEPFEDLQNNAEFKAFKEHIAKDGPLSEPTKNYFEEIQSAYIAPITTGMFYGEIDAVFNVSSEHLGFFSDKKQEIITDFVAQAATAITKTWQKKRKEESHKDYKGISKVLEDISKNLKGKNVKPKIYSIALKGIERIIRPETITIYILNKSTGILDNVAEFESEGMPKPFGSDHSIEKGLTGSVFRSGRPIRLPNLQRGDRSKPQDHGDYSPNLEKESIGGIPSYRVEHYLGVPMLIGNEVIGVIQLVNKKSDYHLNENVDKECWLLERGFSDDCENVLGIAATYLSIAIKNNDLFEAGNRTIGQLKTLQGVGRYTSAEMPLDQLLKRIIIEAAKVIEAETCLLFLLNDDETRVNLEQRYGISKNALKDAHYELGEGITGTVAKTGKSRLMGSEELKQIEGKYTKTIIDILGRKKGKDPRFESLMVVPIIARNQILGVIKAINKRGGGQYDYEDLEFFEAFGNYIGIAIENAQKYELTNQRLIDAEKNAALSFMLRAVVHEINNTEAVIPLNVQIIRDRISKGIYDIEEMIDVIEDSAGQAVAFANSIQAFSASRIGKREPHDINKIVEKAINQLEMAIKNNKQFAGIQIEKDLSTKPLIRSVYETPLIQVFQNVILNACQAMKDSTEKVLKIRSNEDTENNLVNITFADTGTGIKDKILNQIFDPGFTTKIGSGTGIGLWLSETHLKSINAEIKVDSALNPKSKLEKGSEVIIQIPLDTANLSEAK